jgi:hypothetical protein
LNHDFLAGLNTRYFWWDHSRYLRELNKLKN